MPTAEKIEEVVRTVTRSVLGVDVDSLGASFREDLGADSLDMVEIAMGLEAEFEDLFPIEDGDFEKVTTPQAAIDFVANKLGGKNGRRKKAVARG